MDANYFANLIANAPVQTSARYFEAGSYLVEIDNCKIFTNRQRRPRAAVDVTVIDSNNVNFPQTSQISWVVSLDSDSGPSTLKSFVCDILACQPHEITQEVMLRAFINTDDPNTSGQRSMLIGQKATVNAYEKPTKSGGIYTKCAWKRFDAESMTAPDFKAMTQVGSSVVSTSSSSDDADWGGSANTQNAGSKGNWNTNTPY